MLMWPSPAKLLIILPLFLHSLLGANQALGATIRVVLKDGDQAQELKQWELTQLTEFKKQTSVEKDPQTGNTLKWKGISLSQLLEKAQAGLTRDRLSQVDLVVLKGEGGVKAVIPRAFVGKYPVILATALEGGDLGARGPLYSVVPWTSNPKTLKEGLPLESFFIPGVREVELTNSHALYGGYYLKRRTDPSAMRGEKVFVQNCVSCHDGGSLKVFEKVSPYVQHPTGGKGAPALGERETRSVNAYMDAFRAERQLK